MTGQRKSAIARRGFPVEWVLAEFSRAPAVSTEIIRAIRDADLILYAPGSLYTSMMPVLQLEPIVSAIRANRGAVKILGANFWIQEGETDIPLGHEDRGYRVSDLIVAYDRNVQGGARGLFHVVLAANLDRVPASTMRNYALEGKRPIHLDRHRVEGMGVEPVEVTLFSPDRLAQSRGIQHDATRFAIAVRTLWYARGAVRAAVRARQRRIPARRFWSRPAQRFESIPAVASRRSPLLCVHRTAIDRKLRGKEFRPGSLREVLLDHLWENRDVRPVHLDFFRGVRVVPESEWRRSREWDNVLGYFDPDDGGLKIHEQLMDRPERLREDLTIALGESLLGRYIESRRWVERSSLSVCGARCYEIRLRPARERRCYLGDPQLKTYLRLARMICDPGDARAWRITINNDEGFLPPGLLFGLLFAWYLNNAHGGIMEYEMSLLRWAAGDLIPHQAKERVRRAGLIDFFRNEVFGHPGR